MKCAQCNQVNDDTAKFCESCGQKLGIACGSCGAMNVGDSRFCENCGASLSAVAAEKSVTKKSPMQLEASPPSASQLTPAQAASSRKSPILPIVAGLLVLGGGTAYFLMGSPAKQPIPAPMHMENRPAAANPSGVLSSPSPQSSATAATSPTGTDVNSAADPVSTAMAALKVYPLSDIEPKILEMLAAQKNNDESAIDRALEALKAIPLPARGDRKIARAANAEGLAAIERSAFSEAVFTLSGAVKEDPSDQEIVNNLAFALEKSGRYREARQAAYGSLLLAPSRSSAWANLGTIYAEEGQSALSVSAFLLTHRYSKNQTKTVEFLQKTATEHASATVKEAAAIALTLIK